MALTAAERQRRSRAHNADDHRFCDPLRCPDAVTVAVTETVTSPAVTAVTDPAVTAAAPVTSPAAPSPPVLQARGRRLWRQVLDQGPLSATELVLLEEACRLADRCDRLDAFLRGESREWARFVPLVGDGGGDTVVVIIDKALAESRQQALALRQVLGDLARARAGATGRPAAAAPRGEATPPSAAVVATGDGQASPAAAAAGGAGGGGVADLTARIARKRGQAPTG